MAQGGASRMPFSSHPGLSVEVQKDLGSVSHRHFRKSGRPHPLLAVRPEEIYVHGLDKVGRNHVWEKEEIQERMDALYKHKPVTMADKIMNKIMYGFYVTFNALTGFNVNNPSPQSCVWRLIVLESFAGVPGFLAASHRHFSAIRHLKRDFGWINTLLEEAENERMHLMICMKMFEAGLPTRAVVMATQVLMTPFLAVLYAVHPKACHRFVGYLEETASFTYRQIINCVRTPGTELHRAWANLKAPPIARGYYNLPEDALWVDVLEQIFADETHHRDVNHTFATMECDDPNPFVQKHLQDAAKAWRLERSHTTCQGEASWAH
jgi:hypothetical protein